jgi:hypothetical protein
MFRLVSFLKSGRQIVSDRKSDSCQNGQPRSGKGQEIKGSNFQLQERPSSPHAQDERSRSTITDKLPKITQLPGKTEVNGSEGKITQLPHGTDTRHLPPIGDVKDQNQITLRPVSRRNYKHSGGFDGRPTIVPPLDFTKLSGDDSPNPSSARSSLTLSDGSSLALSSSSTDTVSPRQ